MQTLRSKAAIIGLATLALVLVLGLLYYFFMYKSEPEPIVFNDYVCEDQSFYSVLILDNRIGVAGRIYELVSSEDGMRYEGPWPLSFKIDGDELEVSYKESGELLATCMLGEVEAAPTQGT